METNEAEKGILLTRKRRDEILNEVYRYYDRKKDQEIDGVMQRAYIKLNAVKAINNILDHYEKLKKDWELALHNGKTAAEERKELFGDLSVDDPFESMDEMFKKHGVENPFSVAQACSEASMKARKEALETENIKRRASWLRAKKNAERSIH